MIMVREDLTKNTVCPYWSPEGRGCLLCKSGLFLPVAEHVNTYCQTINHTSCPQFMDSLARGDNGPESSPTPAGRNRRRYDRIPARFTFRLSEFLDDGVLENLIDDKACTVDFSPGGIRFESYCPLAVDSKVRFLLCHGNIDDFFDGTGMVRWCRSLDNAPLFHVGIAFAEPHLASRICSRLGLPLG